MTRQKCVWGLISAVFLASCGSPPPAETPESTYRRQPSNERLLVECSESCDAAAAEVTRLGGEVNLRYSNVAVLAITLPAGQLSTLNVSSTVKAVAKDMLIRGPRPSEWVKVLAPAGSAQIIQGQALNDFLAKYPNNYAFNNVLNNATALHQAGETGQDVIVAVIDTGTANNAGVVPALAGTVIGGENFVDSPNEPSATSTQNDPHGTMVGTMIAAHAAFKLPNTSKLVQSLSVHAPDSVEKLNDQESLIPMIGTAPDASIYALKVFPADGNGASSSAVLAAMDRALTLKRNFNAGKPSTPVSGDGSEDKPFVFDSLNIQVANLSLGGPSLFPGFEPDDVLTLEMLKAGITVAVATGNEGPAAMTGGSPGTSFGALSVGAASDPIHERVRVDVNPNFKLGEGVLFRPTATMQTASFSSRGPTADGRVGVHLIANGVASFVQSVDGDLALVSGTSFSAPTVAGAAALLRGAVKSATAAQIRSALIQSANPTKMGDKNTRIDFGNGFLDVAAARQVLASEDLPADAPSLPPPPTRPTLVRDNIAKVGLSPVPLKDGAFATDVKLIPGQVAHFFVPAELTTGLITINVKNITPELPPDQQNQLFGDDVFLSIVDAPTSINDIVFEDFLSKDTSIEVPNPQTGLLRIAAMGDWTNAGAVSATLEITSAPRTLPRVAARGEIKDAEMKVVQVNIKPTTTQVVFELTWRNNWAYYPTHDIDLILEDPARNMIFDGATLRSPERVVIDKPTPGLWTALVDGFMLHGFEDAWVLRITDQDGQPLNPLRAPIDEDEDEN